MEVILTTDNLKSLISLIHFSGLSTGIGGAWVLDAFIMRHLHERLTVDKFNTIEFVSKFVLSGLALLWLSGLAFITYYYLVTPEFLYNQKVWAKLGIVIILTANGVIIHKMVLPKIKRSIGSIITEDLSKREIKTLTIVGVVSFISWLFPIVLGVASSLNFTVPAIDILAIYAATLIASCALASVTPLHNLLSPHKNQKNIPTGFTHPAYAKP